MGGVAAQSSQQPLGPPPGQVWVLSTHYKYRDGTVLPKGTLVTEFTGHSFGMVPIGCVATTTLSYDIQENKWLLGKSFQPVKREHLRDLSPSKKSKIHKIARLKDRSRLKKSRSRVW
mmetsp:Transcript_2612/g.5987  ORF Transcript_2612/g.5987 Transcript_2612/m.5987 type:complete len:117 (-) Transcript_2612:260-610(-)